MKNPQYTVRVEDPKWQGASPLHFATDIEAVAFMEWAVRHGATILECRAPENGRSA